MEFMTPDAYVGHLNGPILSRISIGTKMGRESVHELSLLHNQVEGEVDEVMNLFASRSEPWRSGGLGGHFDGTRLELGTVESGQGLLHMGMQHGKGWRCLSLNQFTDGLVRTGYLSRGVKQSLQVERRGSVEGLGVSLVFLHDGRWLQ